MKIKTTGSTLTLPTILILCRFQNVTLGPHAGESLLLVRHLVAMSHDLIPFFQILFLF